MENVSLHGIKSNICPRCEVPAIELGTNMKVYPVREYAIYHHYDYENWIGETDHADITPESLGIRLGQNVFYGLNRVFAVRFTQTRHAPYSLSWVIQAHDGLEPGLSEKARTT